MNDCKVRRRDEASATHSTIAGMGVIGFRSMGLNGEDLIPAASISWRKPFLSHAPVVFQTLNSEHKRAMSKNTVHGVDHGHESGLLIVYAEVHFAKEVRLHEMKGCDLSKRDPHLVVPVALAIDRLQACPGLLE